MSSVAPAGDINDLDTSDNGIEQIFKSFNTNITAQPTTSKPNDELIASSSSTTASASVITESSIPPTCSSYARYLHEDSCRLNEKPSFLMDSIVYGVSLINIIVGYLCWREVTLQTTGGYYSQIPETILHEHHDIHKSESGEELFKNLDLLHKTAYTNWKNLVSFAMIFTALELLRPCFTLLSAIKRGPKQMFCVNLCLHIISICGLIINEGTISLCKITLHGKLCLIRPALLSGVNQASSLLTLLSAILKLIAFSWRVYAKFKKPVPEVAPISQRSSTNTLAHNIITPAEDKANIYSLQWYHVVVPVILHLSVLLSCLWATVHATSYYHAYKDC